MEFKPNDKVRHAGQPAWGVGVVLTAQKASHEGKPCQRLTVRFDGAGKKTISTAFADLRPIGNHTPDADLQPEASANQPDQPATQTARAPAPPRPRPAPEPLPPEVIRTRLTKLPEEVSDPFRSLEARLKAAADGYRYDPQSRGLLDWATAQTGVHDPLSYFSRHELEQLFATYRVHLDRHLKTLLDEARTARVDARALLAEAGPAVQQALRRVNPSR